MSALSTSSLSVELLPYRRKIWFLFLFHINPFAPEPPVTARADPGPFYPL